MDDKRTAQWRNLRAREKTKKDLTRSALLEMDGCDLAKAKFSSEAWQRLQLTLPLRPE